MAIKALQKTGVSALCAHLKETKSTADQAGSAVTSLAESVADSLEEIDSILDQKQDLGSATAVTIPTSGWSADSASTYPYYYDISAPGVTAADRADVSISPDGAETACSCGLCPTCETITGAIRIRTTSVPTAAIAAEYWVQTGG